MSTAAAKVAGAVTVGAVGLLLYAVRCAGPVAEALGGAPGAGGVGVVDAPVGRAEAPRAGSDLLAPSSRAALAPAAGSLRGRIVQCGVPLAGREVRAVADLGRAGEVVLATAATGADGAFSFAALPEDEPVGLAVAGEGVPRPWHVRWVRAQRGGWDLGDLEVPVPSSLCGRVVDERGVPVSGTRVFHGHRPGSSLPSFDRSTDDAGDAANQSVVTGVDGRFSFAALPPGVHFVLVEERASLDAEAKAELGAGERRDLGDLVLRRGLEVDGRVVDGAGRPIAGALVSPASTWIGESMPLRRKGTRTGGDGRFRVAGVDGRHGVRVEAGGHVPRTLPVADPPEFVVVELAPTAVLRGRVAGAGGRPVAVRVEGDLRSERPPPAFAYRVLGEAHRAGPDGSFEIGGLPAGDYVVHAVADGLGAAPPAAVSVPAARVLELTIVPGRVLDLQVVDERGAPVAGAEVVRDRGIEDFPSLYDGDGAAVAARVLRPARRRAPGPATDAAGRAHVVVETGVPVALAARRSGYLAAGVVLPVGHEGRAVRIVVRRGGAIAGAVADPAQARMFSLTVAARPAELEGEAAAAAEVRAAVDARGRFRTAELAPGRWVVAVHRFDMTWQTDPSRRLPGAVPILGAGKDARAEVEVEVWPGETARADVAMPPLGWIRGRVTAAGAPQSGVVVFAVEPGDERPHRGARAVDDVDAHAFRPHTTTDERGEFAFACATPERVELRARHPQASYPSPAVVLLPAAPGRTIVSDIALPVAEIRGAWTGARPANGRLEAYLFSADEAARDPFHMAHHALPQTAGMRAVPIGQDGRFALPFVPAGRWVLRLVLARERILFQRLVETDGNGAVELGRVEPPRRVVASVACRSPDVTGVLAVRRLPGLDGGVFETAASAAGGRIELGAIPPGRYLLRAFGAIAALGELRGEVLAEPVEIVVGEDGAVTPGAVF